MSKPSNSHRSVFDAQGCSVCGAHHSTSFRTSPESGRRLCNRCHCAAYRRKRKAAERLEQLALQVQEPQALGSGAGEARQLAPSRRQRARKSSRPTAASLGLAAADAAAAAAAEAAAEVAVAGPTATGPRMGMAAKRALAPPVTPQQARKRGAPQQLPSPPRPVKAEAEQEEEPGPVPANGRKQVAAGAQAAAPSSPRPVLDALQRRMLQAASGAEHNVAALLHWLTALPLMVAPPDAHTLARMLPWMAGGAHGAAAAQAAMAAAGGGAGAWPGAGAEPAQAAASLEA